MSHLWMVLYLFLCFCIAKVIGKDVIMLNGDEIFDKRSSELDRQFSIPTVCLHVECPEYTLEEKGKDYELRHYALTKWVMLHGPGTGDLDRGLGKIMFTGLHGYVNGENEAKMKLNITYPILLRLDLRHGYFGKKRLHLHFFLPKAIQDHPPKPANPEVRFPTQRANHRFVRSFYAHCMTFDYYVEQLFHLKASLTRDHKRFEPDHFFFAQYYQPNQMADCYNEVWVDQID